MWVFEFWRQAGCKQDGMRKGVVEGMREGRLLEKERRRLERIWDFSFRYWPTSCNQQHAASPVFLCFPSMQLCNNLCFLPNGLYNIIYTSVSCWYCWHIDYSINVRLINYDFIYCNTYITKFFYCYSMLAWGHEI